MLFNRKILF